MSSTFLKNQWSPKEWENMLAKLKMLSLEELCALATRGGIKFLGGNESIEERKNLSAKEQFLLVLDEVDKKQLINDYKQLYKTKNKS